MGHIPQSETSLMEVLSFEEALTSGLLPQKEYDSSRWLYFPPSYSEYRYVLGTVGEKPLICIGINPSTAVPDHLDNTLSSVQRIALANGFDSFIMFNVYAQRATDPRHMEKVCNPVLHAENMKAFRYILSLSKKSRPSVWAAWGTIIEKRDYLVDCVSEMIEIGKEFSAEWFSSGALSVKRGHPHHPLYLKKDSKLDPFDIDNYLLSLK